MTPRRRTLVGIAPWFLMQALLPGAALFLLLSWLTLQFLRDGFADMRQHLHVPAAALGASAAAMRRDWWSCTCGLAGVCACVAAIRLCCRKEKARVTAGFFGELATVIASTRL